jgi:hypothetical protein
MGVDLQLTECYMRSLKTFALMSGTTGKGSDKELQNRLVMHLATCIVV